MAWARKLPSGRWQGHYRDAHGRLQTVKSPSGRGLLFARKSDAKNAAQEQEILISDRRWIDPARSRTTFAKWAEHRLATTPDQRLSTRARDESYLGSLLLPPFGTMPLGSIEPVQVQNWIAELSKTHAPATVAKAYQIFARLMAAAEDSGYIARTPCRAIRLPRVEHTEMRFLSPIELERLAQSVPERHRALVLTAGYIGLRWGELAGLKRPRLNLLRASLEVAETLVEVRGKISLGEPKTTASRRTLALPAFLVSELQTHLDRFATHGELVFAGRDGGPMRRTNFRRRVWLPAVESARLTPLRFHDLRHTAAGLMISQGAHAKLIQSRLGHSSIQVTFDVYGHLLPALDEELAKGLDATRSAALSEISAAYLLHAEDPRT